MFYSMRAMRQVSSRLGPKIRLNLRTPDGSPWDLNLSAGMERFIGHYSQVAGLGAEGPLLEYQAVGCTCRG